MNPRIVVLDGIDNSGKTWVANKLEELHPDVGFCAFPSEGLANSVEFKRVAESRIAGNILAWLGALYEEEHAVLSEMLKDYKRIVVDRFWFSTLLYQGDGLPNFLFERVINKLYERLMDELGIHSHDVVNIIFSYPLVRSDTSETNETKKLFDSKQSELHEKLFNLLPVVSDQMRVSTYSKYFRYVIEFNEFNLVNCWNDGEEPNIERVKEIQTDRVNLISKMLTDATDQKQTDTG